MAAYAQVGLPLPLWCRGGRECPVPAIGAGPFLRWLRWCSNRLNGTSRRKRRANGCRQLIGSFCRRRPHYVCRYGGPEVAGLLDAGVTVLFPLLAQKTITSPQSALNLTLRIAAGPPETQRLDRGECSFVEERNCIAKTLNETGSSQPVAMFAASALRRHPVGTVSIALCVVTQFSS